MAAGCPCVIQPHGRFVPLARGKTTLQGDTDTGFVSCLVPFLKWLLRFALRVGNPLSLPKEVRPFPLSRGTHPLLNIKDFLFPFGLRRDLFIPVNPIGDQ